MSSANTLFGAPLGNAGIDAPPCRPLEHEREHRMKADTGGLIFLDRWASSGNPPKSRWAACGQDMPTKADRSNGGLSRGVAYHFRRRAQVIGYAPRESSMQTVASGVHCQVAGGCPVERGAGLCAPKKGKREGGKVKQRFTPERRRCRGVRAP